MSNRNSTIPPSVKATPPSIIAWSVKCQRPTEFFTSRLGLPQTEKSKHKKGYAVFEGEAADSCRSLYTATREVTKKVTQHFTCKEDLRVDAIRKYDDLSARFIQPMLDKFGPILWSLSGGERVTKIDRRHYPDYLDYRNDLHRGRINLYLYCWLMSQVMRKLPQSPPDTNDLSSDDEPLLPASAPGCRMRTKGDGVDMAGENTMGIAGSIAPTTRQAAPVAPMFTTESTYQPDIDHDERRIRVDGDGAEIPESDSDDENGGNIRFYTYHSRPIANTQAKGKRKSVSFATHPTHHNKRHKDVHVRSIDSTLSSRLHPTSSPRYTGASQVVEGGAVNTLSSRGEGSRSQNFTNLTMDTPTHGLPDDRNKTDVEHVRDATARRASGHRANSPRDVDAPGLGRAGTHEAVLGTVGPQNDSNVHSPKSPVTRSKSLKHTPSSQPRPSLLIPMKLCTQSQDLETLRLRLASKIIDIMPSEMHNPNLILLASFIEVLEELVKASRLQLINIYGDDYRKQQVAVQMWLQCLKLVATFYDITGFKEDLGARDEFLKMLPRDTRMTVVKPFIHGRANLREFRDDRSTDDEVFAKDVASLLFNLGSWGGLVDLEEIEGMTVEFTRDLLAWFE